MEGGRPPATVIARSTDEGKGREGAEGVGGEERGGEERGWKGGRDVKGGKGKGGEGEERWGGRGKGGEERGLSSHSLTSLQVCSK